MTSLLRISNLRVRYDSRGKVIDALDGVFLEIPSRGYTLGVVGESGSGKTTLGLSILNSIEPPGKVIGGTIEYDGKNVLTMKSGELHRYLWQEVSMIYQSAMNSLNPVKKASDPIVEVIRRHTGASKSEANERALKLISEVGINTRFADAFPYELSGGMKQRIIIALALSLDPKILIADEPTSALDVVTQRHILALLKGEIRKKSLSLILITHEISILKGMVDNVAVMHDGEIVEYGPIDKILLSPLHPYTQMLVSTVLTMDSNVSVMYNSEIAERPREVMRHEANYCKYSEQCVYVHERCLREHPRLLEAEKERLVACHKYH